MSCDPLARYPFDNVHTDVTGKVWPVKEYIKRGFNVTVVVVVVDVEVVDVEVVDVEVVDVEVVLVY